MGTTAQADVPGNIYHQTITDLASRASNAANRVIEALGKGQAVQILSVDFVPESSQAGSATNYADVTVINLGSDGAGTAVMATKSFSAAAASVAALATGAFTLSGTPTKTSGQRIGLSYTSQGNGIALVAHAIDIAYRYL